ncbi:hypothetical protein GIB67_037650 [Kingdonia uniflora]|uniref:Uncharacterized protein n=1 Tax=Kingdonia uniflora TaxID=39325 RepID=A0A7J7LSR1_9MAGN|nr:hypothetical protein GIB67_037650 [Kingdonia uniflora]
MDMEVKVEGGIMCLDPELLQLLEVSAEGLKAKPQMVEDLYLVWLSLPETSRLIKGLLDDAKAGAPLNGPGNTSGTNAATSNSLPSMFPAGSAPPLSPRSTSGSPRMMKRQGLGHSSLRSPLKLVSEPLREVIPQFYFQYGRPPPNNLKMQYLARVDQLFFGHLDGLKVHEFKSVTKEICKLPSFFSSTLFRRIDIDGLGIVTRGVGRAITSREPRQIIYFDETIKAQEEMSCG